MTGTAETEAGEFQKIYKLDVTVIPTNKVMIRKENQDLVFRTAEEKFRNAAKEIKEFQERGQPVLVGTISVEKSEHLSKLLSKMGVKNTKCWNAKQSRARSPHCVAGRPARCGYRIHQHGWPRHRYFLLGGNPESMARDAMRKQGKDPEREEFKTDWERTLEEFKANCKIEHRCRGRPWRAAHYRHRTPRFAAHR